MSEWTEHLSDAVRSHARSFSDERLEREVAEGVRLLEAAQLLTIAGQERLHHLFDELELRRGDELAASLPEHAS
jgi:hypothetical protein